MIVALLVLCQLTPPSLSLTSPQHNPSIHTLSSKHHSRQPLNLANPHPPTHLNTPPTHSLQHTHTHTLTSAHTHTHTHSPQHKDHDCGESEEGRDVPKNGHPRGLYPRTDTEGEGQVGPEEIQHKVNNKLHSMKEKTCKW